MLPVLFHVGPLEIKSYGVFIALAFLAAWVVLSRELRRRADRADAAGPLIAAAAIGGFIGARLYWLAEHANSANAGDLVSGAGFTWYGGVLGGTVAVLLVARLQRIPVSAIVGSAAPTLALGYALGRIACQMAGDGTYGKPSDLPWAMAYPDGEIPTTVRVHPTPVYETLTGLLIFAVLWRLRERLSGPRLFGVYLVLAGTERFLVEFLRINDRVLVGLTQPQIWAATFVLAGIGVIATTHRRDVRTPQTGVPQTRSVQ
ncbi:prolipoprotein diacylglyceryl transferase [Patulibacter sp. NPDC049589]|uniref:prolipoprotein diacylglyceryl transferase n=1 Tax=Patulibacter sp. NPDC049589 TaxID=3154731 RepID=UPI003433360F